MKQPVSLEDIKGLVKRRFGVSNMHWYNTEVNHVLCLLPNKIIINSDKGTPITCTANRSRCCSFTLY